MMLDDGRGVIIVGLVRSLGVVLLLITDVSELHWFGFSKKVQSKGMIRIQREKRASIAIWFSTIRMPIANLG